jgi:hypothetical protein
MSRCKTATQCDRKHDRYRHHIAELEAEIAILEEHIELLWRETDGILPSTGRMWLTPRMERETIKSQQESNND